MGTPYDVETRFILNERWLFDVGQSRLIDLDDLHAQVTLRPVATRLLALLARAPNTVLSRQRLLDDGWRAFGFEVCENSLNQVIHTLRVTFGKIDPERTYICSVPRIGYGLVAEVRVARSREALPRTAQVSGSAMACVAALEKVQTSNEMQHAGDRSEGIYGNSLWTLAQREKRLLSLLLLHIDQLNSCEEVHGQADGSKLLANVERHIGHQIYRTGDTVWRHDMTLFAIQLMDTDLAGALHVAHRIRAAMSLLCLTASIGIVCNTATPVTTLTAFVNAALAALQIAKRAGGGNIVDSPPLPDKNHSDLLMAEGYAASAMPNPA